MTKIRLLLFLSLFFCFPNVYADTTWTYKKKNSFFIEAGGKGPDYSINYSRIFKQGRKLIYSWRAGFSLLAHDLSFPIAVTAFTKRAPHHLEFSLGLTPYIKGYKTFLHKNDLSDKQFYITPSIGYRYQKINGIFFLSAGLDPLIFTDPPSGDFWNFTPEFKQSAHLALGFLF